MIPFFPNYLLKKLFNFVIIVCFMTQDEAGWSQSIYILNRDPQPSHL